MAEQSPGMSPESIKNGTGKEWAAWLKILDDANATTMTHTQIAKHIDENYDVGGWWAQGIAIGYEYERGMRERGMTSDGFATNASKTLNIPVEQAWGLWANDDLRAQWLDPALLTVSSATPSKSFNAKWNSDDSRVSVHFTAKGEHKSSFGVQQRRLPQQEDIDVQKAFWKEAITRLVKVAEQQGWL